jgi:hypothetical protein
MCMAKVTEVNPAISERVAKAAKKNHLGESDDLIELPGSSVVLLGMWSTRSYITICVATPGYGPCFMRSTSILQRPPARGCLCSRRLRLANAGRRPPELDRLRNSTILTSPAAEGNAYRHMWEFVNRAKRYENRLGHLRESDITVIVGPLSTIHRGVHGVEPYDAYGPDPGANGGLVRSESSSTTCAGRSLLSSWPARRRHRAGSILRSDPQGRRKCGRPTAHRWAA